MPGRAYPNPYLGPIITLSPSSLEEWTSCRRRFRNKHLLDLADNSSSPAAATGHAVHDLLRRIHEDGVCTDDTSVELLCAEHYPGDEGRLLPYVEQHRKFCPAKPDWGQHEAEFVRFSRRSTPRWLLAGRIDAVWCHDGVLDARDYKTGMPYYDRVADVLAARVQAYLLAPIAQARGLELRLSYEHLNGDPSPDPWEVEAEDIETIGAEVHSLATEIAEEETFEGCANPFMCGNCRYTGCTDRVA